MNLDRFPYLIIGSSLMIVGLVLGYWFYSLDVGNYTYLLTVGPSQNQIFISTSPTLDSIGIFVCGALFSTGLSMITSLLQPKK